MDHFPTNWGRPRASDAFDLFNGMPHHLRPDNSRAYKAASGGIQHTQDPIVTGTSVLAFKYKDGIMMAADNLASYGSLARYKEVQRMHPVGSYTVIGAGGDMSDFQEIQRILEDLLIEEETTRDNEHKLGPSEIHEFLARMMYGRRSKFDPLWNVLIVGGMRDGEKFLSYVDLKGVTYSSATIATGFGAHLAQPLLRSHVEGREDQLTEQEALAIMEMCMKVLFYRDARSINKYQIATVTDAGVSISDSRSVETEWMFAEGIRGYGAQTQ